MAYGLYSFRKAGILVVNPCPGKHKSISKTSKNNNVFLPYYRSIISYDQSYHYLDYLCHNITNKVYHCSNYQGSHRLLIIQYIFEWDRLYYKLDYLLCNRLHRKRTLVLVSLGLVLPHLFKCKMARKINITKYWWFLSYILHSHFQQKGHHRRPQPADQR